MDKTEAKFALEELTMIMLYLSGFKENDRCSDSDLLYAWKGYNFDVLKVNNKRQRAFIDELMRIEN